MTINQNGSVATEPTKLSAEDLGKCIPATTRISEVVPAYPGAAEMTKILARVGRRYAAAGFNAYIASDELQNRVVETLRDYANRWEENQVLGQGLFFYGPRGTGKDHLAIATIGNILRRFDVKCEWVDGQEFYASMRDKIAGDGLEADAIRRFTAADLFILSDPLHANPKETLTRFEISALWRIIDRRYRDLRPTWVTVNVANFVEASERLSPQIADRLIDGAKALHCDWKSYRKPSEVVK